MAMMILFSQYLEKVWVPVPKCGKGKQGYAKFKIFNLFPVLLTILIMWAICGICTLAGVDDPAIRTDRPKMEMFKKANWVRFPLPCKLITCVTEKQVLMNCFSKIITLKRKT